MLVSNPRCWGKIDILVNNAAQVTETDILHCTEEEVFNVFKKNTLSIILGIQTVMPEFEKLGRKLERIPNTSR